MISTPDPVTDLSFTSRRYMRAGSIRSSCSVKLQFVNGRDGKVAKATLTASSNSRRGSGEAREDEATVIQWTLWGKGAENAAE